MIAYCPFFVKYSLRFLHIIHKFNGDSSYVMLDKNKNAGSSVAFLHFYYNFRSSVCLLCRLAICKRTGVGVLLEYLVEIVCVAESDLIRDIGHRHIGLDEVLHRLIDSQAVYVVDGSLAYTVLEHLDKLVV